MWQRIVSAVDLPYPDMEDNYEGKMVGLVFQKTTAVSSTDVRAPVSQAVSLPSTPRIMPDVALMLQYLKQPFYAAMYFL
jgi:hypothetical protein